MRAVILLAIVAAVYAAPHVDDKRFILDTFQNIGHWFTNVWNGLQDQWHTLTSHLHIDLHLDQVVANLIPLIDSGMTEGACTTVCTGAAATVLGPAAALASTLCDVACKAALAKLASVAG